jgi:hypothetical protein
LSGGGERKRRGKRDYDRSHLQYLRERQEEEERGREEKWEMGGHCGLIKQPQGLR